VLVLAPTSLPRVNKGGEWVSLAVEGAEPEHAEVVEPALRAASLGFLVHDLYLLGLQRFEVEEVFMVGDQLVFNFLEVLDNPHQIFPDAQLLELKSLLEVSIVLLGEESLSNDSVLY